MHGESSDVDMTAAVDGQERLSCAIIPGIRNLSRQSTCGIFCEKWSVIKFYSTRCNGLADAPALLADNAISGQVRCTSDGKDEHEADATEEVLQQASKACVQDRRSKAVLFFEQQCDAASVTAIIELPSHVTAMP